MKAVEGVAMEKMQYSIVQDGQFFYTKGLKEVYGYEFLLVLDALTASRSGEKAARGRFDEVISYLKEKNEIIEPEKEFCGLFPQKREVLKEGIPVLFERDLLIKKGYFKTGVYWLLVFSDVKGRFPWDDGCIPDDRCGIYGSLSMDNILPILDEIFLPDENGIFSWYVRWTSECNGDFYRTCYRRLSEDIADHYYGYKKATHIVVAFETPFSREGLGFESSGSEQLTKLKMQLCPISEQYIDETIQWNLDLQYPYYRVIDLLNRKDVTDKYPKSKYSYFDYPNNEPV